MQKFKAFLKRKNIEFSVKRYLYDALSAMAQGLFASLIIGLILSTLGEQVARLTGENLVTNFLIQVGDLAKSCMGAAIGASVALGLKAPPLVVFSALITGTLGATVGGPAGAFVAAAVGAEFGKAVSKETKVDIIVTPAVTLIMGALAANTIGPVISALMKGLGAVIMKATELQPFFMGIVVSVIMGLVLTAPISSAALAIMLELSGLAAGAATVGCCAQMIGFAFASYRENKMGGEIANICKNPWILLPPTLAAAVLGPLSTLVFKMTNVPEGAGMGTSGLVGQIGTFSDMGFTVMSVAGVALLHFILPAILAVVFDRILRKTGKIKDGDYLLEQ